MKAILVLDMPNTCGECPYSYYSNLEDWEDETKCCAIHKGGYLEDYDQMRAVWCPLKPMPEKIEEWENETESPDSKIEQFAKGAMEGWNACLREIENVDK